MPAHSEFDQLETGECRGCGKTIVWGVTEDGKKIPLDPTPPVYGVAVRADGKTWCARDTEAMVLHFATCPDADQFSGGKHD